jgi:protein gp37
MKPGQKCRLKYFTEMEVKFVSSVENIAYVRRLNSIEMLPFPIPISELEPVQECTKTCDMIQLKWFKTQLETYGSPDKCEIDWKTLDELFEQAKQMNLQNIG